MKSVDRATKFKGRRSGNAHHEHVQEAEMVGTRSTPPLVGMLHRPVARQPPMAAKRVAHTHCTDLYQSSLTPRAIASAPGRSILPRGSRGHTVAAGEVSEESDPFTTGMAPGVVEARRPRGPSGACRELILSPR